MGGAKSETRQEKLNKTGNLRELNMKKGTETQKEEVIKTTQTHYTSWTVTQIIHLHVTVILNQF